ncbi:MULTISPECIES: hypothetical protein [unclassified Burkholderia]|uniref:hypothetical protein n=2 Tax=unclassified Burkholderia TaxID=2613784 RepID=UPI0005CF00CA|nr:MULTISPECIES: hypothetical protein [unclassified Burkholderia]RQR93896.1 hypothetical protein DIE04_20840 [Burkholderia sp. Bp8994]RQS36830.1 hypothetical protein DIE01_24345 [Burkholderia sp. Bp8990]RQS49279.1 hypothetical protein DIE00_09740 [Burkholderia sp. Bp8989]RQZ27112.1 hypothetical protein DIE16_31820 [Burkholderia sp. Bp9090]TGN96558.1 hypothetical protein PL79_014325 [Burkholderia sp. USMB20]
MYPVFSFLMDLLPGRSAASFSPSAKVNRVTFTGAVDRSDGVILSINGSDALVRWPKGGKSVERVSNLVAIVTEA